MEPIFQEIKQNRHDSICRLDNGKYCVDGKQGVYTSREDAVRAAKKFKDSKWYRIVRPIP